MVIKVPSHIREGIWRDFSPLCALFYGDRRPKQEEVLIDFSDCEAIDSMGVCLVGGLIRLLQNNRNVVQINPEKAHPSVYTYLMRIGFISTFTGSSTSPSGEMEDDHAHSAHHTNHDVIPFQVFRSIPVRNGRNASSRYLNYLIQYWIGRGWVSVTPRLSDSICSQANELFQNSDEHGRSPVGTFACGSFQKGPSGGELVLSVVDFGLGIPKNVRQHLENPGLAGYECLEWAFKKGHSTRKVGTNPGGVGLYTLKDFIRKSGGSMDVVSRDGRSLLSHVTHEFKNQSPPFPGTAVEITIKCDETLYKFESEIDTKAPLFAQPLLQPRVTLAPARDRELPVITDNPATVAKS